jgi:hypothetical protein
MAEAKSSGGDNLGVVTAIMIVVGIGVAGVVWLYTTIWGEQEGQVNYEDCRNKITIQEGSADALFKDFTCTYGKTRSGKILNGICAHVVTEGPVCQTVYIYSKKSQVVCSDPKFPFAGYDDLCHMDPQ